MNKKGVEQTFAKSCYGHLGGELGDLLFERMLKLRWFKSIEGKSTVYEITKKGYQELTKLGVDFPKLSGIQGRQYGR